MNICMKIENACMERGVVKMEVFTFCVIGLCNLKTFLSQDLSGIWYVADNISINFM